jgi:hypothetical protein
MIAQISLERGNGCRFYWAAIPRLQSIDVDATLGSKVWHYFLLVYTHTVKSVSINRF